MLNSDVPSIGLLGLGLLGRAVARRLEAAGYSLIGYDPDPAAARAAEDVGVSVRGSARQVAGECTHVVTCLPDGPSVSRAVLDVSGSPLLMPRSLLIDLTTCAPRESRLLSATLKHAGIEMLDAPISGGSREIARGLGLMMVGGGAETYAAAGFILSVISDRVRYLGPSGSGSTGKLVTNLVLGLNRLALAEGLSLAEACGLELTTVLDLLKESAAYSYSMDVKGARMTERRYDEPEARLRQHLKDVHLILELAAGQNRALPVSKLHAELLGEAVEAGLGEADNAAIFELLRHHVSDP